MSQMFHGPSPEDHYTLIPDSLICDRRISPEAKELFMNAQRLSKGQDFAESAAVAQALGKTEAKMRRALNELVDAGYTAVISEGEE